MLRFINLKAAARSTARGGLYSAFSFLLLHCLLEVTPARKISPRDINWGEKKRKEKTIGRENPQFRSNALVTPGNPSKVLSEMSIYKCLSEPNRKKYLLLYSELYLEVFLLAFNIIRLPITSDIFSSHYLSTKLQNF